ncbi:MAG: hypothetical protein ACYTEQ_05680 [Planctomycetota bacterium]|jgi:type II restriction enzyme
MKKQKRAIDHLSGWQLDVYQAICGLPGRTFKLADVYGQKARLQKRHPENKNIEAKIRQQLQKLRDLGIIEFVRPGVYRKKK